MHRASVLVASAVLIAAGCAPAFKDRRTPSGDFCSDMAVVPADEETNLEYHRLVPVQSDMKARTEAERLESLRKAACLVGGDAVIEAVNEEVRNESAQFVLVSSGTAVIWVRPKSGVAVPLVTHKKNAPPSDTATPQASVAPVATPSATPPPPPATVAPATPTAAPVASVAPAATTTPSAAPVASTKPTTKLPTNTAPKPLNPTAPKKK